VVVGTVLHQRIAWQRSATQVAGAGLLFASGAIHLDLYLTGYRSIPTVGTLFLLQEVVAFGLGVIILVTGSRLASAVGAGFALSTLVGYLISLEFGLFGFREVPTVAGVVSAVIDLAAFAVLAMFAFDTGVNRSGRGVRGQKPGWMGALGSGIPGVGWAIAAVSVIGLALLGTSLAVSQPASAGSTGLVLRTTTVDRVPVITDAMGFTLYWFEPDTPNTSHCSGSCAAYWPPLTGTASAGPGVPRRLGSIRRSDGSTQVTYAGHPLYTYVGDASPGQANGNDLNLNGGKWHEMAASG
jgi:predicted lipoprotein with Yx(FWY)xxD motif